MHSFPNPQRRLIFAPSSTMIMTLYYYCLCLCLLLRWMILSSSSKTSTREDDCAIETPALRALLSVLYCRRDCSRESRLLETT